MVEAARALRRQFVLGRVGLRVLQLHLQLVEQPLPCAPSARRRARAAASRSPASAARSAHRRWKRCLRPGQLGLRLASRLAQPRRSLRQDHRMGGGEIGRERFRRVRHAPMESHPPPTCKHNSSSRRRRTPGFLRHSPIDALQQIAELRRRDRHRSVGRRRPQEPSPFQPFGEQAQALAIAPKALDQIAAPTAEDKQMAAMRIALQRLLDDQRKPVEALAHVGMARRQPHPNARSGSGSSPRQRLDHPRQRGRVHIRANNNPLAADQRNLHPAGRRRWRNRSGGHPFVRNRHRQQLQRLQPTLAALLASRRRQVNNRLALTP